uniref:Uncharacterized protein n=1 Tax=Leclercia adecarboxylata TaxID=83655 RepID=A0A7D5JR09_9ENTR|nr:hypothetical protein [Leclercia adecarboxylata]
MIILPEQTVFSPSETDRNPVIFSYASYVKFLIFLRRA